MNLKVKIRLATYLPIATIVAAALLIGITNYSPGAFLSGWDTLHPEFNLELYAQRVVFGAWQPHQGLGAPASQAHLSEVVRLPLLWALSILFPIAAIRYVFFLLMFLLGGLGLYFFIKKAIFAERQDTIHAWAATAGALFYLFNLGTLQHFYVPLEMFAVHFATIGFVLLTMYKALMHAKLKYFFWFFILQILSAPSAHTATLFYMYQGLVFLYAGWLTLFKFKNERRALINFVILCLLTLIAHAYWLIPNFYYIVTNSQYVQQAKISRLFSSEAFWQNQAYGQLHNVIILKNFLFNWKDYDFSTQTFVDLFNEWDFYLKQIGYAFIYLGSFLSLMGIALQLFSRKAKTVGLVICFFFIPLFFLVNLNFPIAPLFAYIQNSSSLFKEALRFPFTKFSIMFMVALATGYGYIAGQILTSLTHIFQPTNIKLKVSQVLSIAALLIIPLGAGWPMVTGNLISPAMHVQYPPDYFELFTWAQQQPSDKRIAKFPLNSFWGWNYYAWPTRNQTQGYQGAGFLWFGLPQPLMDREFDRWISTNEYFYTELQNSQYELNQTLFNQSLEKYQISYLLFDNSVISPETLSAEEYRTKFINLITNNPKISLVQRFGNIEVYEVQLTTTGLFQSPEVQVISTQPNFAKLDSQYALFGNYIYSPNSYIQFPFANLTAERLTNITTSQQRVNLVTPFRSGEILDIPAWYEFNHRLPVEMSTLFNEENRQLSIKLTPVYPEIKIGDTFLDLNSHLASSSVTLSSKPLPNNQSFDSLLLLMNDTFYEVPVGTSFSYAGQAYISLTQPTTVEILPATFTLTEEIEVGNVADTVTIETQTLQPILLPAIEVSTPTGQTISVTVDNLILFEDQTKQWYEYKDPLLGTCSNNIGTSSVKLTQQVFQFTAKDKAIACEKFLYPSAYPDQEYILRADSQNTQGMAAKIFVNEFGNRERYLEEILDETQSTHYYSLLGNRKNFGLEIDVSSISFGPITTKNELSNLQLFAVPLQWLANIDLRNTQEIQALHPLAILDQKMIVPNIYMVTVNNNQVNSPLVFTQSFDSGWVALAWKPGWHVFDHSTYNNWANVWVIPQGEHQILIFYWPQLVSFIGYGVVVLTTIIFAILFLKQSRARYS